MNKIKIMKIVIVTILIIIIAGLGYIGNYFYNLALNPNTSKEVIFGPEEEDSPSNKLLQDDIDWLENESNYTNDYINSSDGLKLHSYKIVNKVPSNKWAIVVHGYTSEAINMSSYAKKYYDMGYNVLMPNLRGHAQSEGDYIGMGWDDRLDIISWISKLVKENMNCDIVLHGVSMGAATVAMASGEDLYTNVEAIVADCGYTSVWNQFAYQLDDIFSLPEFPIMHASSLVGQIRAGYSLKDASTIEQVKKSETPILYIHGDKDDFVPYSMMEELYNATSSEKEMLTIKGAEHAKSSEVNPKTYWTTVHDFINKYVSQD